LCAISPTRVQSAGTVAISTPDDHFAAAPNCRVRASGAGRVTGVRCYPTIRFGPVSSAGIKGGATTRVAISAPYDHFASGPDCRLIASGSGRVDGVGGYPTIRSGTVYPPGVNVNIVSFATPHDHFTTCPDRGVIGPASGRVSCVGGGPTIRAGIVSSASVQIAAALTAPDDHFAARPDRRVMVSAGGRISGVRGCPTVRAGIVSPAGIQTAGTDNANSAPNDHFAAGPHCRVIGSASGRISCADGCPTIRAGIVPPASGRIGVEVSTPDDHFAAGPNCRVIGSARGCINGARGCPTVRAGIVSAAGIQ
jgi:hypothetical protein